MTLIKVTIDALIDEPQSMVLEFSLGYFSLVNFVFEDPPEGWLSQEHPEKYKKIDKKWY